MWDIENNRAIGAKPREHRKQIKRNITTEPSSVSNNSPEFEQEHKNNLGKDLTLWEKDEKGKPTILNAKGKENSGEVAKDKLLKSIKKSKKGCIGNCFGMNGNGPYGAYYGKRRTGKFDLLQPAKCWRDTMLCVCVSTTNLTLPGCCHHLL